MNPQISLFERTTPMQYKNDAIKIKMEIPSVLQEELLKTNVQSQKGELQEESNNIEESLRILQEMYDMYTPAMKVFNSDVSVGSKAPLYEHVGRTMRQLKTTNFSEGGDSREQDIDKILVTMLISHLCDHLKIRDKVHCFILLIALR